MISKTLIVGIASYETMKTRTLRIARGQYRPKRCEPKVWFTSLESFSKILTQKNQELLRIISQQKPNSLVDLETMSGRKKSNLSRTLKAMEQYGLVELTKSKRGTTVPRSLYNNIKLDIDLTMSA